MADRAALRTIGLALSAVTSLVTLLAVVTIHLGPP